MAKAPNYKINSAKKSMWRCKRPDDAGAIVALYGRRAHPSWTYTVHWCGGTIAAAGESYTMWQDCWAREHAVLELS
jgi:hypothetical protein